MHLTLFYPWSLKARITFFTLAIFMLSIWSLAFYANQILYKDMKHELSQQQFSTVSVLAAQVNQELEVRLKILEKVAEGINSDLLSRPHAVQQLLERHSVFQSLFNGGTFVTPLDGTAIASLPVSLGRVGVNYLESDNVASALQEGKSKISKPVIGKLLGTPVVSMATPIRNKQHQVIGAVVGVTDLGKPNFLDKITEHTYGRTGGYFIIAKPYRLIIKASDKSRVMEALPPSGVSPVLDRFVQGYEGSELFISPRGVEVLTTAKSIPIAEWYLAASLPTAEAFAPIIDVQNRILKISLILTLLAGLLIWWLLLHQISPLLKTAKQLSRLSEQDQIPYALPIKYHDEIGDLIGGFNHLIAILAQREEKIQDLSNMYAALSRCNHAIVQCKTEAELFPIICRDVVVCGGMKMAWIGLVDDTDNSVKPVAWYGEGVDYLEDIHISVDASSPYGHGPTGISIRENHPFWCQDFQQNPATAAWHERGKRFGWQGSASIPLLRNGIAVGAFTFYAGKMNAFTEKMQELLIEMAMDISFALNTIALDAAHKQATEKVHHLSFYDALTKLPNRRLYIDKLNVALSNSVCTHCHGAVLSINIDKLKSLNDTSGHHIGNLLLIEAANRLRLSVHELDTVACFGGNEFVVLLEAVDKNADSALRKIALVTEKIHTALSMDYQINEQQYYNASSIGVCVYSGDTNNAEELLKRANIALRQAKDVSGNTVRFFDPVMQLTLDNYTALENDLRRALPNQQLQLFYQIQVDSNLRPLGAETLVRWLHSTRGMVSPAQFIPLAEESALIIDIGDWVLDTACRQLAEWAKHEQTRHLVLAVNVSAKQFKQPDFIEKIRAVLRRHEVKASQLKVELTESVVLNDVDDVVAKMHALKVLGIKLSMDDFGTGYSSLSYLKQLPLDQIKIDQSFVRDMTSDQNDTMLVQTIIDMAKNFRLNVIAEGVETEAQLMLLTRLGCMAYQGYYFSKPVPLEQFETLLTQQNWEIR